MTEATYHACTSTQKKQNLIIEIEKKFQFKRQTGKDIYTYRSVKFILHLLWSSLLLGRKVMTNLDSILKSRDITLPTKVRLVKAMVFPVVIYECESWTIKKAEGWRIDAFELRCWRRLLSVPWTARRSNQSILKEINPGCSLEGLMTKLKLQFFGYLMKSWLTGKDPDAGRDWGQEEKGMTEDRMAGWHHQLDGHVFG